MKRTAVAILIGLCACKKHDPPRTDPAQTTPVDSSAVAAAAPSDSAAAAPSTSASVSPEAARAAAIASAQEFGMIGLLGATDASAPWGRDDSLGKDPLNAKGNMWGDTIGDSFGAGGLGLTGVGGDGGGGHGEGIGLGNIGTIGHGGGGGSGQGYGSGHGSLGGAHGSPRIRQGSTSVNGRLPPEVIQRIVRQNFGRFRVCYEKGLVSDPKLAGTVATKFVIDRQGNVSNVTRDASTTLTDATVVSCVTSAFSSLVFPQPEGGIVTVVYPLIFNPGDTP